MNKLPLFPMMMMVLFIVGCQPIALSKPINPTLSPLANQGTRETTGQYLDQGKDLYNKKEFAQAIAYFDQAIQSDAKNSEAYLYLGRSYEQTNEHDQAIKNFKMVISLDSANDQAYTELGKTYMHKTDLESAINAFAKAIELVPNHAENYFLRSIAYTYKDNLLLADADARKAVELEPNNPEALNTLCWNGSLMGKAAEVLASCDKAVEQAPTRYEIIDSRGLARALTGDLKGAAEDFQKAVDLSKDIPGNADFIKEREGFIVELKKGNNPFDDATLKRLQHE